MKFNDEEVYKKMEIWWMDLKRGNMKGGYRGIQIPKKLSVF